MENTLHNNICETREATNDLSGPNLPPALFAEWPGSFTCHCGNTGWNGHRIRVSAES